MAKGSAVTRELFQTVKQLQEIYPGYKADQIAEIVKREVTVVRVMFRLKTWEDYETYKKEKAQKQRTREKKKAEKQEAPAEEQVPGQIRMEIPEKPEGVILRAKWADEMSEELPSQVKMMRFQAAQVDKLMMKLDRLNDTMNMILRAVRRE